MADIKPGDEVRVLQRIRRRGQNVPEGGYAGTVTKVARKYGTAAFTEIWTSALGGGEQSREREIRFDLETGSTSPDVEGWYVRTPEQLERENRRKMALFLLENQGIEVTVTARRSLTLEQIEALAEVVKSWEG